ncbi:MAG TPA: Ig domain-containing protein, partial [Nitrospiria bacterium]
LYFDKTTDTFGDLDGNPATPDDPIADGKWTHGNGLWDGPEAPGTSGGTADTTIWRTIKVVFTGPPSFGPFTSRIVIDSTDKNPSVPSEFQIPHQGCGSFRIYTGDVNNNALSTGSSIEISSNGGEVFGGGIIEMPNRITGGPHVWDVDLCDPDFSQVSPAAAPLEVIVHHDEQDQAGTVTDYAFPLVRGIIDFVPPLTIVTPSFPDATQNVFYSQTPVASGGVPPYTWAIASGALPNLLSMDSVTGTISGSPDTLAACPTGTFTIRLIDWIGQFVDQAFCINVVP